jgi:hypothetical protein
VPSSPTPQSSISQQQARTAYHPPGVNQVWKPRPKAEKDGKESQPEQTSQLTQQPPKQEQPVQVQQQQPQQQQPVSQPVQVQSLPQQQQRTQNYPTMPVVLPPSSLQSIQNPKINQEIPFGAFEGQQRQQSTPQQQVTQQQ